MQWSLFLLILMGHWSSFTCQLYKYHFIREKKTWDDAQKYCREKYTDLATVFDMTDMKRLRDSTKNQDEAWIGLYNKPGRENRKWHWSLPGVEFIDNETEWNGGEPNDQNNVQENCVRMDSYKWKDVPCSAKVKFICYDGQNKSNKFHFIDEEMTWPQAQNYCRHHHTDLISGLSQIKDKELNETKSQNNLWIGLFRDTWRWSDGSNFSFRNWDLESNYEVDTKKCAMTVSNGPTWGSDDCDKTKPFFCYRDKVILIKENKTWVEALYYCREKHKDLVFITNSHQQRWVQERAKNASTAHVWLGLRYTCTLDLWFWISDKRVSYENWASEGKSDDCDMSAAMERGGEHKWFKKDDTERFNFICTLK